MKKNLLMFLLTLFIVSCTTNTELSYTSANLDQAKTEVVTYDLYIPKSPSNQYYFAQLCIDIEIQGQTYPFIVDTGDRNGSLKFSQNTINKLTHSKTGKSSKSLTIYGNNTNHGYIISGVQVGDVILNNVEVEVTDDSWFYPFNKYNEDIGIVGWNFLREFNILFDYKNGILKLYQKGYIPESLSTSKRARYTEENKLLYISGKINEDSKRYDFLLDSGAGNLSKTDDGEIILIDTLFDNSFNRAYKISTPVVEGLKRPYITNTLKIDDLEVSNMKFGLYKNIPWFLKYKFEGFLGIGFFTDNTLFFDTANSEMYLIE